MIITTKTISAFPIASSNVFEDIFIPVEKRNGFSTRKSPAIPVYSYSCIGVTPNSNTYYEELRHLDSKLTALGTSFLRFTKPIPIILKDELMHKLQPLWEASHTNGDYISIVSSFRELCVFSLSSDNTLCMSLEKAFSEILTLYIKSTININSTLFKNFCLKLLSWVHEYIPSLFQNFSLDNLSIQEMINPKVVFYGEVKEHEVYFLILLSKLGIDVLYINTLSNSKFEDIDRFNQFSFVHELTNKEPLKEYPYAQIQTVKNIAPISHEIAPSINLIQSLSIAPPVKAERRERTYEELARLSGSTVMIRTFNRDGESLGTGSGVVIDTNGLIVTNQHVIEGGLYYGIIFEGMEENRQHETYTVINRDKQRDLALIRIYQNTTPVEIDAQAEVVRGQRVVAIGSPLGLMNTFSDGIISGFRKSDKYDFIQTTAPISPGSSGGALINMYGHLIGVTSAGYFEGQNLNLAVPSKYVIELLKQKCTIINQEITNCCSTFAFGSITVCFDGFFSQQNISRYRIGLYQSRHDKSNFLELTRNQRFVDALENYYMENVKSVLMRYGIQLFDFELGSQKYVFSYSYSNGKITNKRWGYIKD